MAVFKFKQFDIKQEQAAMKVGTDGVLLGAWASTLHEPDAVLDIGTGTGLIALQLAQRSEAELIDAIEIDPDAFEEAVYNFEASHWGDRLFAYHCSLAEFVAEIDDRYDLIVSNPPFFQKEADKNSTPRGKARNTVSLSFDSLFESAAHLLSEQGVFALILPYSEYDYVIKLANREKLYLNRCCFVKGTATSAVKRVLLEFSFSKTEVEKSELIIELKRHQYTSAYINLVQDFYLKM